MQSPEKLDVVSLFRNQQRYVVPMYQRKYVWGRERQWEPLWNDVRARAEAIRARGATSVAQHFLGAIVLQRTEQAGLLDLPAFTIIDGQQRLTTLQVFLAALGAAAEGVYPKVAAAVRQVTSNSVNDEYSDAEVEWFKVWPSTFDRPAFTAVMSEDPGVFDDTTSSLDAGWRARPRLVEAARFFHANILDWVAEGPEDAAERIKLMHAALAQALQLVVIKLDASDDAQVIFETLNARGVPLRPSDLVRNFVFLQAAGQKEDPDALYERYWREFDREGIGDLGFWSREDSLGREKQPRFVAFLVHFLESELARELAVPLAFDAFQEWWRERATFASVEEGLAFLAERAELYRGMVQPDKGDRVGRFLARLNTLQYRTAYPLVLHLLGRFGRSSPLLTETLEALESWMVRRFVCRLTTRGYGQVFIGLVQRIVGVEDADVPEAVRTYLGASHDDSRRWPSDTEFQRAWRTWPVYRRLSRGATRMILAALDDAMSGKLQELTVLKDGLTLEHIMPVQWRANWPSPSEDLATDDESAEEVRDRLVHTFGNLTLLTQELNSKNSNAPYELKRGLVAKQSALRLNSYFVDAFDWDDRRILERADDLYEVAIKIWPGAKDSGTGDGTRPSLEPSLGTRRLQMADLRVCLTGALPDGYALGKKKERYVQVFREGWPRALHYEVGIKGGEVRAGLHCEFNKNDPRREYGHQLMDLVSPHVAAAIEPDSLDVKTSGYAWRNIDVMLPIESEADEVVRVLRTIVEATFDLVDEHVEGGYFERQVLA